MNRSGRIAFVPPRYGAEILGGAEAAMRNVAMGLSARGWDIEVLTTCAADHFDWANVYEPGTAEADGLVLRRFPAVVDTPRAERAQVNFELQQGARVDIRRQQRWINDDMRSPALWHHLHDHASDFRAIVFAPYHAWTTYAGAQIAPGRSIIWTKLHAEPQAYLDVFQSVITGARGIWFQSEPERELALEINPRIERHAVVGAGLVLPVSPDPQRFRARHGIEGPFVLYAGRREGGKGWPVLLEWFLRAVARFDLPLKLVTMGGGAIGEGEGVDRHVIDIGFVDEQERDDAFAAADAYLQPSALEALSLTVLESMYVGTPVIANAASDVVRWHCERSGAGLVYANEAEFAQALCLVADRPDLVRHAVEGGRRYVEEHYDPDRALDRCERAIEEWT